MRTPGENGATELAVVRQRARDGAEWAIRKLKGPPFPEPLRYLYRWLLALLRGLRRDADGQRELTWIDLDAWARRSDVDVQPHEADALFLCHDVMCHPRAYLPKEEETA